MLALHGERGKVGLTLRAISRSSETELDDNHDTLWGFVSSKLGAQTRRRDQEEESSFAVMSRGTL